MCSNAGTRLLLLLLHGLHQLRGLHGLLGQEHELGHVGCLHLRRLRIRCCGLSSHSCHGLLEEGRGGMDQCRHWEGGDGWERGTLLGGLGLLMMGGMRHLSSVSGGFDGASVLRLLRRGLGLYMLLQRGPQRLLRSCGRRALHWQLF